jgi:hypothetical protein
MAFMIPDSTTPTMNKGEVSLYKILHDSLPNNFYVWYETNIQESLPYSYFTILSPNFGLLIIAVCNLFPYQIVEVDSQNFKLKVQKKHHETIQNQQSILGNREGRRTRKRSNQITQTTQDLDIIPSPIQALDNHLAQLLDELKKYSILTELGSQNPEKNIIFPLGACTIMSNFTQEQANKDNISQVFNENQVIYKEELQLLRNFNQRELINRLERIFALKFSFSPLTSEQIETIKGILYPEIVIKKVEIESANNTYAIKTLDHRQECIVKAIGTGHRLIYGVAGSGKTLILLSRAKLLANKTPENHRILILCFNRSLGSYLKSVIDNDYQNRNYRKIDVFNFHKWANSIIKIPRSLDGLSADYTDDLIGEMIVEKLNKTPISWKWDAVLVDEAQTFFPSWFKACVAALKDPENGDLLIVSDGNKGLYKRKNFTWKSVGIKAVGRTANKKYELDKNYRNTKEILDSAWSLVSHTQNILLNNNLGDIKDYESMFPIIEPQSATRNGCLPCLHILPTANQEIEAAINLIQQLRQLGYDLRDIAVIYREDHVKTVEFLIHSLERIGLETYWVTASREMQKKYSFNIPGVRIIGNLSSLGLEFKVVLIIFVQSWEFNIPPSSETDALVCRRLYVAMTRAQDVLHIFGSGNSPLLEVLKHSNTFEVKE